MNSYGYDYYVPNDSMDINDSFYLETIKPYNKIENFDNDIDDMINTNNDSQYNSIIEKKDKVCNQLYNSYNKCKYIINRQFNEIKSLNNQLYFFYIFLFVSIVVILFQRGNINNLQHMIYMLHYNQPIIQKKY